MYDIHLNCCTVIFVKWLYYILVILSTVVSYNINVSMVYNIIMLLYHVDWGPTLYNLLSENGNVMQGTIVYILAETFKL